MALLLSPEWSNATRQPTDKLGVLASGSHRKVMDPLARASSLFFCRSKESKGQTQDCSAQPVLHELVMQDGGVSVVVRRRHD